MPKQGAYNSRSIPWFSIEYKGYRNTQTTNDVDRQHAKLQTSVTILSDGGNAVSKREKINIVRRKNGTGSSTRIVNCERIFNMLDDISHRQEAPT
jgi:hypothetical protein